MSTPNELYKQKGYDFIYEAVKKHLSDFYEQQDEYYSSDEYALGRDTYQVVDELTLEKNVFENEKYWDEEILDFIKLLRDKYKVPENLIIEALWESTEPEVKDNYFYTNNSLLSEYTSSEEEAYLETGYDITIEGVRAPLADFLELLIHDAEKMKELCDDLNITNYGGRRALVEEQTPPSEISMTVYLSDTRSVEYVVNFEKFYRNSKPLIRAYKQAKKYGGISAALITSFYRVQKNKKVTAQDLTSYPYTVELYDGPKLVYRNTKVKDGDEGFEKLAEAAKDYLAKNPNGKLKGELVEGDVQWDEKTVNVFTHEELMEKINKVSSNAFGLPAFELEENDDGFIFYLPSREDATFGLFDALVKISEDVSLEDDGYVRIFTDDKKLAEKVMKKAQTIIQSNITADTEEAVDNDSHVSYQYAEDIAEYAGELLDLVDPSKDMEDWVDAKIAQARQHLSEVTHYLATGEKLEDKLEEVEMGPAEEAEPVESNFFEKEALKNDYNGKVAQFKKALPKVYKAIMNSENADSFQGGINEIEELSVDGKIFYFIETPGHGFYFDANGNYIGEEDDGLQGDWAQYNSQRGELHKAAKTVATGEPDLATPSRPVTGYVVANNARYSHQAET